MHATKFYRDGSRQLQNKAKQPQAQAAAAAQVPIPAQPIPAQPTPVDPEPSVTASASSRRDEVLALVQSATAGFEPQLSMDALPLPPPALEPTSAAASAAAMDADADDTVVQDIAPPKLSVVSLEGDAMEPNSADAPSGSVNAAPSNTRPTNGASKPVWLHVCTKAEASQRLLGAGSQYTEGRFLVYMDNMKRGLVRLDANNKVVHAQVKSQSSGLNLGKYGSRTQSLSSMLICLLPGTTLRAARACQLLWTS